MVNHSKEFYGKLNKKENKEAHPTVDKAMKTNSKEKISISNNSNQKI